MKECTFDQSNLVSDSKMIGDSCHDKSVSMKMLKIQVSAQDYSLSDGEYDLVEDTDKACHLREGTDEYLD